MDHQAIKDLLPLAALDRLEPDEARALQEHLSAGCAECEPELREFREAAAALALSLDPQESQASDDRIWQRLQDRLDSALPRRGARPPQGSADAAMRGGRGRLAGWRVATAVMAAAVAGLATYCVQLNDRIRRAAEEHQREIVAMDSRMAALHADLVHARDQVGALNRVLGERVRLEKVLSAPDLRLTRLEPLTPAKGASAVVAVSASNKSALLQAVGMPATPPGTSYELWWITKEHGPVAAGVFTAEAGRPVVAAVSMPPAGEHVLLSAVTLEPAGGMPKPTGAMYLKGAPGAA